MAVTRNSYISILQNFMRGGEQPKKRSMAVDARGSASMQRLYRVAKAAFRNGRQPLASELATVSQALGELPHRAFAQLASAQHVLFQSKVDK